MTKHKPKSKRLRQAPKRKPISNKPLRRHATKPSSDGLEIEAKTILEDRKRITDALIAIKQDGNRLFRRAAEALIQKLQAVIDGDTTVATLASKTVMLGIRKAWVRDVVELFAESSGYPMSFVTLLPIESGNTR